VFVTVTVLWTARGVTAARADVEVTKDPVLDQGTDAEEKFNHLRLWQS
jgi:hypothetical protein